MSKIIQNDAGEDEEVFTKAELDAQLADKDAHVAAKLEEFKQGKTAQELKEIERDRVIAETKAKADEAIGTANTIADNAHKKVIDFIAGQFVGEDKDLRTKLDGAYEIIEAGRIAKGLDTKGDASIKEMMLSASQMAGLSNTNINPTFPMTNGMAPNFRKSANEISDAEHEQFLRETGQEIPKKAA